MIDDLYYSSLLDYWVSTWEGQNKFFGKKDNQMKSLYL